MFDRMFGSAKKTKLRKQRLREAAFRRRESLFAMPNRRARFESLEDRRLLAAFSEVGSVLNIQLDAAAEDLSVVSNGADYTLTTSTGSWTGTNSANVSAVAGDLTVTPAGIAAFTEINVTDVATGTTVSFADSGVNSYSNDFIVTLDDAGAGDISFDGSSSFAGTAMISAGTTQNILLNSASSVTADSGGITLSGDNLLDTGSSLTAVSGLLTLSANAGLDITTMTITANNLALITEGTLQLPGVLTVTGDLRVQGADVIADDGTIDLNSNRLWFVSGVGESITTTVDDLDIRTGGPMTVNNFGSLRLLDLDSDGFAALNSNESANISINAFGSNADVNVAARVSADGDIMIRADDAVTFTAAGDVLTTGGNIVVTANAIQTNGDSGDGITMADGTVLSGAGAITLSSAGANGGDITLGSVQTSGDVGIFASLAILDGGDIDIDIIGDVVTLSSGTGVGQSGDAISGVLGSLSAIAGSTGGVFVTETDGFDLNTITVAANGDVDVFSGGQLSLLGGQSIATTGTGSVSLTSDRNIFLLSASSLTTVDGGITVSANASGTTAGNFSGLVAAGAIIQTTGTGDIVLTGSGGEDVSPAGRRGVELISGTSVSSMASGANAGTITIDGTAGDGISGQNIGVFLLGSNTEVTSVDGAILITGTGSGTGGQNYGVDLRGIGRIESTGTGVNAATITIVGTGGNGDQLNNGVNLQDVTTDITSRDGAIAITGTGGLLATSVGNSGVSIIDAEGIASTGTGAFAATITIMGTGGGGTGFGRGVFLASLSFTTGVTSVDGAIAITGTGGMGTGDNNHGVSLRSDTLVEVSNTNLTVNGTATSGNSAGVDLSDGGQLRSVAAGAIQITAQGTTTDLVAAANSEIGGTTAAGPISINADSIAFSGTLNVQSTGDLTIQPRTPSNAINLGSGAPTGGLHLDATELGFLADGFTSVTLGDPASASGAIAINGATFRDPLNIFGSSISVLGQLNTVGDIALNTLDASDAGQDVAFSNATVNATGGNLTINSGDNVDISGDSTVNSDTITVTLDTGAADVGVGSTVNFDGSIFTSLVTINGGSDADTFVLRSGNSYDVIGGDPLASPGDTLDIQGLGEGITVSESTVAFGNSFSTFSGIETIAVTSTGQIFIDGSVAPDNFGLRMHPTLANIAVLAVNSGLDVTFDTTVVNRLDFFANDGDDTLTVDLSNGVVATDVSFDGGGNVSTNPGDQIVLTGTPPTPLGQMTFSYFTENSGSIDLNGLSTIDYSGLEPITSSIAALDVTLSYSDAIAETISVTQTGGNVTVDSDVGEITTFLAPTNSLTIDSGTGTDTISINGLNVDVAGLVSIIDGDASANDTVTFTGNASTIATGGLTVLASTINIDAPVTVGGAVTLGESGGASTNLRSDLTTNTGVDFLAPLVVDSNATITASGTGGVTFNGTLDGTIAATENLVINDTTANGITFSSIVGGINPLASLTVGVGSVGANVNSITTTGDLVFNSPLRALSATLLTSTTGGNLVFNAIDGAIPSQSVSTSTTGTTTLNAPIGSVLPVSIFQVTTGAPYTSNVDINASAFIRFTVPDTTGTADNVSITGGTITAPAMTVTAGDSVTIESAANVDISTGTLTISVDPAGGDQDAGVGGTATIQGTVTAGSAIVSGGVDADTFTIRPQATSAFDVFGDAPVISPGDRLIIDAAGANVDIDAETGAVTIPGTAAVTPTDIEDVSLVNIGVLTVVGDVVADFVTVSANALIPGQDLLVINGLPALALSSVTSLIFNGGDGDDILTVDVSNGVPTTPITFNGQSQNGSSSGDTLNISGSVTSQTLNYTAPGPDGNSGSVVLDAATINYTGLEPINAGNSIDTILSFNTGAANNATLQANASPGFIEIIDNGATFENTIIPNPTNSLTVNLGDFGDTFSVNTLDAAYAASMIINGGTSTTDSVSLFSVGLVDTPGRGLTVSEVESLLMSGGNVSGNSAPIGGGILINNSTSGTDTTAQISGVGIQNNIATGGTAPTEGGGGIYNNGANLTIDSGTFIFNNRATTGNASGGGVFSSGTLTINSSTIDTNFANRAGGGIEIASGSGLTTIVNSLLARNNALAGPGNGGGLHITGAGDSLIQGATITENVAAQEGGGLWNGTGIMTVNGGTDISRNSALGTLADQAGGGVFNNGGTVNLDDVQLNSNIADSGSGSGGGGFSDGGTFNVTNSTVNMNQLFGIVLSNASASLTSNTFGSSGSNVGGDIGSISGTPGNDTITVSANAITIGTNTITYDATIGPLTILGGDGDDALIIDLSAGPLLVPISFDGGLQTTSDSISIIGGTVTDLVFNYVNANDGSIQIDAMPLVTYTGLEPITSTVTATNVVLNYSSSAETITLTQSGTDITATSSFGETTTFAAPSGNLTVNTGGGADTVVLDGLSLALAGTFLVSDPDAPGDDIVRFQNSATTIVGGQLAVLAAMIDVAQPLSANTITLGNGSGNGLIQLGSDITTVTNLDLDNPVQLTANTTLTTGAAGATTILFEVDGPSDLTIDSGSVDVRAAIGAVTRPTGFTATAQSGSIILSDVTTDGPQVYNSRVVSRLSPTLGTLDLVSTSTVTFNSTVDAGSGGDSLAVIADGVLTINGSIGSSNAFDSVSLASSVALTLSNPIAATGLLSITVRDTATVGEDLTLAAGAQLNSILGTVSLSVGDNLTMVLASSISAPGVVISVDPVTALPTDPEGSIVSLIGTISAPDFGTTISGGAEADAISLRLQTGTSFEVDGGDPLTQPGDTLNLDAGGSEATIDAGTGALSIEGRPPITPSSIEKFTILNVSTLTIVGTTGVDNVRLGTDPDTPGDDLLVVNGFTYSFSGTVGMTFNGGDEDDVFTFDATGGVPTTPVTFNGQASNIGGSGPTTGDSLVVLGSAINQVFNYTAPGTDGNNGSVVFDTATINYTGLEPITGGNSVNTVLNFNTGATNDATLRDNSSPGFIEIIDNGSTFEDTVFPNPTGFLIINLDNTDTTLAINPLDSAFAASLVLNGSTGFAVNSTVNISDLALSGIGGRGLDAADLDLLSIVGSTFSGNTADIGAGLRLTRSTTTIDNSTIDGNTATTTAGGIFVDGGSLAITNSFIQNNNEFGLVFSGADGTVTGNTFANNTRSNLVAFLGTTGNDSFTVTGSTISNGINTITYDGSVGPLTINGGDGDDTLTVDFGTGGIPVAINFNGEGQSVGDAIVLQNGFADQITFNYTNANDGSILLRTNPSIRDLLITYTGLEPITSTLDAIDTTLNYSGASESITLSQIGTEITANSTAGETTTFVAPTGNLTLNTDVGTDTITIDGLSLTIDGQFFITETGTPDDTVIFSGSATTIAGSTIAGSGSLDIDAPQIQVNTDLSVGDATFGAASGTGRIQTGVIITSLGDLIFTEPISLTGDTSITSSAGLVRFQFPIDGSQNLTASGNTALQFLAENGATTPLSSLTATASTGVIRLDDFNTFGNQVFNSPVVTNAGGGTVELVSTAGRIIFASTIDNGSTPADGLLTDSDDVTEFNGAIGSINPLDTLTVNASGPITVANNISVLTDIAITTADSGTDNFILQSAAAINAPGTVTLNILDDVTIQSGASIVTGTLTVNLDDPVIADDDGIGSTIIIDGTITATSGTSIVGGPDADNFNVTSQSGSQITVDGGGPVVVPGDVLTIDAGDADVTIDATGVITVTGRQGIAIAGLEGISLSNVGVLTVTGDASANLISLAGTTTAGIEVLTTGALTPISLSTIGRVVINGGDGDDVFTFDASVSTPITPVTFNGQQQTGTNGGDTLNILGSFSNQTFNYTAPGTDGNNGSVVLDGATVNYTGLEPINSGTSVDTVLNFNTGLFNNATLRSTPGGLEIVDNGATFEDTRFAVPTNSLTINLDESGDTLLIENLVIAASLIVSGGIGSDEVTINNTIISGSSGRGLDVASVETLAIAGSEFSNNQADSGAGIRISGGTTTIGNSRVVNNVATQDGGGIAILSGNLSITASEINTNQAGVNGGGIFFSGSDVGIGTLILSSVTIVGNTAVGSGGGIALVDSALLFENVTFSGNTATTGSGGGLQYDNQVALSPLQISFSTFSGNSAGGSGGSISATGTPIDVRASIFNNGSVETSDSAVRSLGSNIDSGNSTSFDATIDFINTDPLLGPLQDNGGPVLTHALLSGSPAIDAAGTTGPTIDARGIARPIDGTGEGIQEFDIGAFEADQAFALFIDDIMVNEDIGSALVTVRIPNAFGSSFTVDFATSDGSAFSPGDYTATTGTLSFAGTAGETQTFLVPITSDLVLERTETILVSLFNASAPEIDTRNTALVNILDDDTATLSVNNVTVDENAGTVTVTVSVDNAVQGGFSVGFSTSDGSALVTTDYTMASGTLTFLGTAGETQAFTIPIIDDRVVEPSETILVALSNPSNQSIVASDTAIVTITDDDTAVLSLSDVTVDEDAGTATITVSVNIAVQDGFTVEFSTLDSTAIAPSDYLTASGTLTFSGSAGETQQFTVDIVDDAVVENTETFNAALSNASIAGVDASATAIITILDNDFAPTADLGVAISGAPSTVELNGTVVYTVVISNLGPDAATSVISTTILPAGFSITNVSATGASVSNNAGIVTANVDSLDSGSSITVEITATVGLTAGSFLVSSSVNSSNDINATNDSATVTTIVNPPPSIDLSLTTTSNAPIFAGATGTLDFQVSNLSAIDATNVIVLFTLDPNVSFESGFAFPGTVTSLPTTNQVRVEIPSLTANQSSSISLSVTARNNLPSGLLLTTSGTVSATEPDSDLSNNLVSAINSVLGARTLTTGGQDGGVVVTVDALGSMGRRAIGGLSQFNPIGPIDAAETLFEAGVLLGQTPNGTRKVLTSGSFDGGGEIPPNDVTLISDLDGNETRVTSSFLVGTLQFDLVQELLLTLDASGTTIGSTLSQTYTITNTATTSTSFDLVRFLDADLEFDGEINDGGGVQRTSDGDVLLFVTETSTLPGADTTFVGIQATGGTTLASDRFQISEFSALERLVIGGTALNGAVTGDLDGNDLIDAGQEYDVSLALRNLFQLGAGASTTYATSTFFGSGPISPRSSITGHVFCDANGSGAEEAGEAEGNVTVFVDLNGNRVLDVNELSTLTNASGDFFFSNVAAGAVTVAVVVPDGCNTIPRNVGVARTSLDAGRLARSIATVDLDGDLDMDLVVASDLSNSVTIFENNGGVFSIQDTITLSDRPQAISAWSPGSGSAESVLAVAGFGTPSNRGNVFKIADGITEAFKAGDGPIALVVDDFNGDSIADIVSVASRSSDLSLTLGKVPTGADQSTIGVSQFLTGVRNIRAVITGDFNGDGNVDIAAAGLGFGTDANSELKVLLGRGNATFDTAIVRVGDREIVDIIATDIDGDGHDELLALSATGKLKVYRLAELTLSQIAQTSVSIGSSSFAVGDFNGDGMTDVAVANLGDEIIELFVGDRTGRFFVKSTVTNVTAPSDIVVADFDGDGKAEIAVSNFYKQLPEVVTAQTPRNKLPSTLTILKLNIAEQAVMVTSESTSTVNVTFPSANPATIFDVNRDSFVSAVDALEVISAMRQNDLALLSNAESELTTTHKVGNVIFRAPQRLAADVNGDGRTSALDALMVINYLNQQQLEQLLASSGESLTAPPLAYDSQRVNKDDEDNTHVAAIDALFAGGLF